MPEFLNDINWKKVAFCAAIIIAVTILLLISKKIYSKNKTKVLQDAVQYDKSANNLFRILYELFNIVIIIVAVIWILQINGVNVGSLVAGLGIASAIIGLALQDVLKDTIMGIRIITDHYFKVGDSVRYGDFEGIVVAFGMRSTRIKSFADGTTLNISNRNLDSIIHIPSITYFDIHVPLSYEEDIKTVRDLMKNISKKVSEVDGVDHSDFIGTSEFNDSSISYTIRIHCYLPDKYNLRRVANGIIQDMLDEAGIEIPYNQLDIHQK